MRKVYTFHTHTSPSICKYALSTTHSAEAVPKQYSKEYPVITWKVPSEWPYGTCIFVCIHIYCVHGADCLCTCRIQLMKGGLRTGLRALPQLPATPGRRGACETSCTAVF